MGSRGRQTGTRTTAGWEDQKASSLDWLDQQHVAEVQTACCMKELGMPAPCLQQARGRTPPCLHIQQKNVKKGCVLVHCTIQTCPATTVARFAGSISPGRISFSGTGGGSMEPLSCVLTVQPGSPSTGWITWPNTCAWIAAGLAQRWLRRLRAVQLG